MVRDCRFQPTEKASPFYFQKGSGNTFSPELYIAVKTLQLIGRQSLMVVLIKKTFSSHPVEYANSIIVCYIPTVVQINLAGMLCDYQDFSRLITL